MSDKELREFEDDLVACYAHEPGWNGHNEDKAEEARTMLNRIKADVWDEAFEATCEAHDTYGGLNYTPTNPYRTVKDN